MVDTPPAAAPAAAPAIVPAAIVPAGAPAAVPAAAPEWTASLAGDAAALVKAKGWKQPVDLLTSYMNLEKTVGQDKVALPGKDAKPEDWDPVWKALGRPDKPEGYSWKPKDAGVPVDEKYLGAARQAAHKIGLSDAQFAAMVEWNNQFAGEALIGAAEAIKQSVAAAEAQLKSEFGAAFAAKMAVANEAVRFGAGEALLPALKGMIFADGTFVGDNPAFVRVFARLGEALRGAGALAGDKGGNNFGAMTPAAAKAEIDKLKADKAFGEKFLNRQHPEHKAAMERMRSLQLMADPELAKEAAG